VLRSALALAVICCLTAVTACGGDGDDSGDGGGGGGGPYGTGLELGTEVLKSSPVGAAVEPWYRWNGDSCKFEVAKDHPSEYKADIRNVTGGDTQIGYMHYGNSDTFGVANTKSVTAMAEKAGMPLDVYNLKFPSRTEPLSAAKTAGVKQNKGVLQANLDPSILPKFFEILEEDNCIPSVQMYIPIDDHPAMGANWPDVGKEIGAYIAEEAQSRGWKPEDTAIVQCTDPDNGPTVNIMFEEVAKAVPEKGFAIPEGNVFDIVCKLTESQSGQKRVTDWFTSHPDFKHVAITSIDSPRMQSILKAVEREGRPDEDTILADTGLDPADQKSVRSGEQDLSVAFFPERYGDWLIPILQDVMAGNPVPKFVGTELVRGTKDNVDELYPE
jgi:ribose transport system substrate-binding protein